jgi:hypothetical protein
MYLFGKPSDIFIACLLGVGYFLSINPSIIFQFFKLVPVINKIKFLDLDLDNAKFQYTKLAIRFVGFFCLLLGLYIFVRAINEPRYLYR